MSQHPLPGNNPPARPANQPAPVSGPVRPPSKPKAGISPLSPKGGGSITGPGPDRISQGQPGQRAAPGGAGNFTNTQGLAGSLARGADAGKLAQGGTVSAPDPRSVGPQLGVAGGGRSQTVQEKMAITRQEQAAREVQQQQAREQKRAQLPFDPQRGQLGGVGGTVVGDQQGNPISPRPTAQRPTAQQVVEQLGRGGGGQLAQVGGAGRGTVVGDQQGTPTGIPGDTPRGGTGAPVTGPNNGTPSANAPISLQNTGGVIERQLGNPSRFDQQVAQDVFENFSQGIQQQGLEAEQGASANAASRGVFFGTPLNSALGKIGQGTQRALGDLRTNIALSQAQTFGQDQNAAIQNAMQFGQNALAAEQARSAAAAQLAQLGQAGAPTAADAIAGFGPIPTPGGASIDPGALGGNLGGTPQAVNPSGGGIVSPPPTFTPPPQQPGAPIPGAPTIPGISGPGGAGDPGAPGSGIRIPAKLPPRIDRKTGHQQQRGF